MTDRILHAVPADRVVRSTTPTDDELAAINERIALSPQAADDLFVWSFEISNNAVDSHSTWMAPTSLRNYEAQANGGRGLPYLRHHDVRQDERGRVFAGRLVDGADDAPGGAIPLARDVFARAAGGPMRLVETAFMVRGLTLNGTSNDDLIRNLEAGVSASNSIGFSVYGPGGGGRMECDICGIDLFSRTPDGTWACPHTPGVDYEVERGEDEERVHVWATAAIVDARQREASGVYLGSTPGTFTLAARAHDLYEAGTFGEKAARRLEEMLELQRGVVTVGRPERLYVVGADVAPVTAASRSLGTAASDTSTTAENGRDEHTQGDDMDLTEVVNRVRELFGDDPDRLAALELADASLEADPVGALYQVLDGELSEAVADRDELADGFQEFKRVVRERLGLADGEDIAAGIDRVMADVAVAREFRGDLVDELLRQMTRAGLQYDADVQRSLATTLTVAQLKGQADMYRETANRLFPAGRQTEPDVQQKPRNGAPPVSPAVVQG